MQGIYIIKNKITGRQYVGSTIDSDTRWRRHRNSLDKEIHHSRYLNHAWKKYGAEAFEFLMVEEVIDRRILIEREQWWLDNIDSLYNMNRKAYSCLGYKWTSEQLAKRVAAQSGDNHWSKKKKFTDEAKKRMSEAQKNLYANGYVNPNKGKKLSQEVLDKIKQNVKKLPIDQFDKQGNYIKTWPSAIEASRSLGKHYNCLIHCLKGNRKHSQGYVWKYSNKELP